MSHAIDATNNIISSIKLPNGNTYEIHDASAIHSVEELGLSAALVFKGTKSTEDAITTDVTDAKVGDVWLCTANNTEYVCVGTDPITWEKLGNIHDAASSTHKHTVSVVGSNQPSEVNGKVTVPTVSRTQKYMTASSNAPEITGKTTDGALGTNATFSASGTAATTKIKATANGVAVGANGTAAAITGFGTHTTDSALGANATFKVSGGAASTSKMVTTTVKNPTATDVDVPVISSNTEVKASKVSSSGSKTNGTAASWTASVDANGVLSFGWTANTPTDVTLPTFTEVTATNTAFGNSVTASKVETTNVTVATGALASNGGGSAVATGVGAISVTVDEADAVTAITALGTPTTANALTGVQVTSQPTVTLSSGTSGDVTVATGISSISVSVDDADTVDAITGFGIAAPAITLTNSDSSTTGAVPVVSGVTIGSAEVDLRDGQAAAQQWTQGATTVSTPV